MQKTLMNISRHFLPHTPRYAIEKLGSKQKRKYMDRKLKTAGKNN